MSLRAVCLRAPEQSTIGVVFNKCPFSLEEPTFGCGLRAAGLRVVNLTHQTGHNSGTAKCQYSGSQERQVKGQVGRRDGVFWKRNGVREGQETLVTAQEAPKHLEGGWEDERRSGVQKVHESSRVAGVKKRGFMLTQALREWPLDVDLDAQLGDAMIGDEQFGESEVHRVMHYLGKTRANEVMEENAGLTKREGLPELNTKLDDVSDANRALNLFSWWQRRNPTEPQTKILLPLLTCLAQANLQEEIQIFAQIFSTGFNAHSLVQSMLIKAFYFCGDYEEAISVYNQMREDGVEIAPYASAAALLAMGAREYPGQELLAVFRDATWKGKFRAGALCYMLRAGVSVDQIRAAAHDPKKPHLKVAELVLALCDLDRQAEARAVAEEVIESEMGFDLSSTINLIAALERGGLVAEGQRLLEKCVERGINVGAALQQLMVRTRDARAAIRTYNSIMRLDGYHHSHFFVHRDAIVRFSQLDETDGAIQAYREAMQIKTRQQTKVLQIGPMAYGMLINTLASAGRGAEAEAVLADYYATRNESKTGTSGIATIQEMNYMKSPASRLVGLYFGVEQPENIVELLETMAANKLWLSASKVERWLALLKEKGVYEELIKRFESAMLKMKSYRLELNFRY